MEKRNITFPSDSTHSEEDVKLSVKASLRRLRDEYSDEIPNIILSSGNFKVRRAWWYSMTLDLKRALKENEIPEKIKSDTEEFINHYTSEDFHKQALTTETDIERANELLDSILNREDD